VGVVENQRPTRQTHGRNFQARRPRRDSAKKNRRRCLIMNLGRF